MKKLYPKIILFVCMCLPMYGSGQYKYMFVNDRDGFVNVRADKNASSKIVDKRYNLSIVSVNDEQSTSEWAYIGNGYIHKNRLEKVPEKLEAFILENNLECNGYVFLVAADCPEILFLGNVINDNARKSEGIYPDTTLEFDVEYELININKGKNIDPHTIICPVNSVRMQGDRIIFYDSQYIYSFFRNKKGICCMNLFSFYAYKKESLPEEQEKEIIAKLDKLDDIIRLHKENKLEYHSLSQEIFGINNFELLNKIRTFYYNGKRNVKEYRLLLDYYPLDGEGVHAIEAYYMELWGDMNKGETELDKIYSVYSD